VTNFSTVDTASGLTFIVVSESKCRSTILFRKIYHTATCLKSVAEFLTDDFSFLLQPILVQLSSQTLFTSLDSVLWILSLLRGELVPVILEPSTIIGLP
jgi:hypothetical protein